MQPRTALDKGCDVAFSQHPGHYIVASGLRTPLNGSAHSILEQETENSALLLHLFDHPFELKIDFESNRTPKNRNRTSKILRGIES